MHRSVEGGHGMSAGEGGRARVDRPVTTTVPSVRRRREVFARAGAAVFGLAAVQSANAKAGEFSKQDIFSVVGEPAISSPYQPGGPKAGKDATFGYSKSDGPMLATGYEVRRWPRALSARHAPSPCSLPPYAPPPLRPLPSPPPSLRGDWSAHRGDAMPGYTARSIACHRARPRHLRSVSAAGASVRGPMASASPRAAERRDAREGGVLHQREYRPRARPQHRLQDLVAGAQQLPRPGLQHEGQHAGDQLRPPRGEKGQPPLPHPLPLLSPPPPLLPLFSPP